LIYDKEEKALKDKRGFTLVELLAVIVILAIILAIAVPSISGIINNSRRGAFESDVKMVITGIEYSMLEAQMGDGTAPEVHSAAVTGDDLSELSTYGANPANYTSFQITSLNPVTIDLTSSANSDFGAWTTTGATKTSVTVNPVP
jgi:type IV pilus assembly protein PilA